jgi:hypothetical protein
MRCSVSGGTQGMPAVCATPLLDMCRQGCVCVVLMLYQHRAAPCATLLQDCGCSGRQQHMRPNPSSPRAAAAVVV